MFEPHTASRTRGAYRLLILDEHGCHITQDFNLFAKEHKNFTIYILPHRLYLSQPLDVSCFASLKRVYGRQIEQLMRAELNHIDKADFLTAYSRARIEAITPNIARSGFKATGLVPYDPDRLLSKLKTQTLTPSHLPLHQHLHFYKNGFRRRQKTRKQLIFNLS